MVQYVTTPWRDRRELLGVRRQFYPDKISESHSQPQSQPPARPQRTQRQRDEQHQAVARVALWVQRGNCPHMVESTALLMAAILGDEQEQHQHDRDDGGVGGQDRDETGPRLVAVPSSYSSSSNYASRAAYSAAFSRFVTGLLDGHQSRQHKLSMYAVAKTIGLPATFVELRHQSTHEQLPSLARLRAAAGRALKWVWGYYWTHLGGAGADGVMSSAAGSAPAEADRCRNAVAAALGSMGDASGSETQRACSDLVRSWGRAGVLEALQSIVDEYDVEGGDISPRMVLAALRLLKEMLSGQREVLIVDLKQRNLDSVKSGIARARLDLEAEEKRVPALREDGPMSESDPLDCGWGLCSDEWRPKPIGMV